MIGEVIALIETMQCRITRPHGAGRVYVGRNYCTAELLDDLKELKRLVGRIKEAGVL